MNKKGRKRLPVNAKKTYQIKARFTFEQIEIVKKKASKAGMPPGVYVANSALNVAVKERLTKEVLADIKGMIRIGVNLNQIAKKIQSDPNYYCQEHLLREINDLAYMRQEIMRKMLE